MREPDLIYIVMPAVILLALVVLIALPFAAATGSGDRRSAGRHSGGQEPQGQMPGAILNVLGYCRQPPVHLPAFSQGHFGIKDGLQKRMGEPQPVTVTFDDALLDRLVDHRPGLPIVTGRADQLLPRVGGGSDQPAHAPYLRRQPPQPVPHQAVQAARQGNGLPGKGHMRVV